MKKILLLIVLTYILSPVAVNADIYTELNDSATSTFEAVVGFPFASTTEYTEHIVKSSFVFPLGFLGTETPTLIAYFVMFMIILFAFSVFRFFRT